MDLIRITVLVSGKVKIILGNSCLPALCTLLYTFWKTETNILQHSKVCSSSLNMKTYTFGHSCVCWSMSQSVTSADQHRHIYTQILQVLKNNNTWNNNFLRETVVILLSPNLGSVTLISRHWLFFNLTFKALLTNQVTYYESSLFNCSCSTQPLS